MPNEFIEYVVDGAKRLEYMIEDSFKLLLMSNKQKILSPVNLDKVIEKTLINLKMPMDENNAQLYRIYYYNY